MKNTRIDRDELQKDLAKELGVNIKQIGRWERNENQITAQALAAFCHHYKVSADYILGIPYDYDKPR